MSNPTPPPPPTAPAAPADRSRRPPRRRRPKRADESRFPGWVSWSARDAGVGLLVGVFAGFLLAPALVLPFDPDLSSDGALLAAQSLLGLTLMAVAIGVPTKWSFKPLRRRAQRGSASARSSPAPSAGSS